MIGIVVDTNILSMSPYLSRDEWTILARHMQEWHVRLLIPEVVLVETINVAPRRWAEQKEKFAEAKIADLGIQNEVDAVSRLIQERIDGYEESLKSRLSDLGADIIPIPEIPHLCIAQRASDRRAPYQGKSKDGYRDTLIWLTVLDLAEENPTDEFWFVSDNHQDFGAGGTKTFTENLESPARTLHQDLRDELVTRGLQGRVRYAASLAALVQHLAGIHLPISEDELEALITRVDPDGLQSLLVAQRTNVADPIDVALSPELTGVFAEKFLATGPWVYSDAATRGSDRWTANYSVEAVARIVSYEEPLAKSIVLSKPVRVSGTISFSNDGQPSDLRVSSVDALPDDPYLQLFELAQSFGFGAKEIGWVMDPRVHAAREDMAKAADNLTVTDLQKMVASLKPGKKKKGRSL